MKDSLSKQVERILEREFTEEEKKKYLRTKKKLDREFNKPLNRLEVKEMGLRDQFEKMSSRQCSRMLPKLRSVSKKLIQEGCPEYKRNLKYFEFAYQHWWDWHEPIIERAKQADADIKVTYQVWKEQNSEGLVTAIKNAQEYFRLVAVSLNPLSFTKDVCDAFESRKDLQVDIFAGPRFVDRRKNLFFKYAKSRAKDDKFGFYWIGHRATFDTTYYKHTDGTFRLHYQTPHLEWSLLTHHMDIVSEDSSVNNFIDKKYVGELYHSGRNTFYPAHPPFRGREATEEERRMMWRRVLRKN